MSLGVLVAQEAHAANLIVNGSFETYSKLPSSWTFPDLVDFNVPVGGTDITGWTVINGPIDYVANFWQASDGSRSLDLAGSPGLGGVSQTFSANPGTNYLVQFDLSGNPGASAFNGPLKTLDVTVAGQRFSFSYDVLAMGNTLNNMKWQRKQFSFVATSTSTTLSLFNTMAIGAIGNGGPALDNVSVEAVAVPTPALLPGLVGMGLAALRRKRQQERVAEKV